MSSPTTTTPPKSNQPTKGNSKPKQGKPQQGNPKQGNPKQGKKTRTPKHTQTVALLDNYIGAVKGKGGRTVKAIERRTNTRISQFPADPERGHLVPCFIINGDTERDARDAAAQIRKIIINMWERDNPLESDQEDGAASSN